MYEMKLLLDILEVSSFFSSLLSFPRVQSKSHLSFSTTSNIKYKIQNTKYNRDISIFTFIKYKNYICFQTLLCVLRRALVGVKALWRDEEEGRDEERDEEEWRGTKGE